MEFEFVHLFAALLLMGVMGWVLTRWFRWRDAFYRRVVEADADSEKGDHHVRAA